MSSTIRSRLRDGELVEFEGMALRMIPGKATGADLEPGDMYFAERNSGPKLLTVKRVVFEQPSGHGHWVVPVENAYSFDFPECVGVEIVDTTAYALILEGDDK